MRTCYDAIDVGNLPAGAPLYLGYVDGMYANKAAVQAAHPNALVIGVAVFASTNDGDLADVEPGNMTNEEAPGWITMRRNAGHPEPMAYTFQSNRQALIDAFITAGVALPPLWIADYNGTAALMDPTDVACQYWDFPPSNPYDVSIVVDYLPGIDPAPTPPTPSGGTVAVSPLITFKPGQEDVLQLQANALVHKWNTSAGQGSEILGGPLGSTAAIHGGLNIVNTFVDMAWVVKSATLFVTGETADGHVFLLSQTSTSNVWNVMEWTS